MFTNLKKAVAKRFAQMGKKGVLLQTDVDRSAVWESYLNGFEDPTEKQDNNCNCCKSFIRQVGNVVIIENDFTLSTVWDIDLSDIDSVYHKSIENIRDYVKSKPIKGLFNVEEKEVGKDKNYSEKHNIIFQHFYVPIPQSAFSPQILTKSGNIRESKNVLKRGVEEITDEAIQIVLELIPTKDAIPRGSQYKNAILKLKELKEKVKSVDQSLQDNFYWSKALSLPESESRIRNTAIGTLLVDLSEGREINSAVDAYGRIVDPTNYKRTSAIATPKMIEEARKKLESLGMLSALERRKLDSRDLGAHNSLFIHRAQQATKDVFAQLAESATVKPKTFDKCETITIDTFVKDILPTCKAVKVLVENKHLPNFVTLTGAVDPDSAPIFKWDNSFGWSYTGGVADSIKERVKAAGGKTNGWGRASLAWSNRDDLDLHFVGKGQHIYFGSRRGKGVELDTDMNGMDRMSDEPVENIYIGQALPKGDYQIHVHTYSTRSSTNKGYELELELNGQTFSFCSDKTPQGKDIFRFSIKEDSSIEVDGKMSGSTKTQTKWGVTTNQWRSVKSIALSPNHWEKPIGNKHWFFILEGCVSDEKTLPFYNEFLCDTLRDNRKVMEMLAGKITVADAEGAELSGLGFSQDQKNEVLLEIEGAFKRTIKVVF